MNISNWLMILAVLLGPVIAIQVQKLIEKSTEKRRSKIYLFKTLMTTRGTVLSPIHVEALNRIDLEFSESKKSEKAVLESWKLYLDHLGSNRIDLNDKDYEIKQNSWADKSKDLLNELLYTMAQSLGFHYGKHLLNRGIYNPQGHVDQESDYYLIRKYFKDILFGNKNFPIWIRGIDIPQPIQQTKKEDNPEQKLIKP